MLGAVTLREAPEGRSRTWRRPVPGAAAATGDNGRVSPIAPFSLIDSGPRRVIVLGSTGSVGTQALDGHRGPSRPVRGGRARRRRVTSRPARPSGGRPPRRPASPSRDREIPDGIARRTGVHRSGLGRRSGDRHSRRRRAQRHHRLDRAGARPWLRWPPGRTLALANKESLVAGGSLVTDAAEPGQIVPVDSEHSALAQCLRGGDRDEVARLVITASGGPFRGRTAAQLEGVTARRRARPPDLGHGAGGHDQLGDPGQQGAGGDRGAPAVRPLLRPRSTSWSTRSRSSTRW